MSKRIVAVAPGLLLAFFPALPGPVLAADYSGCSVCGGDYAVDYDYDPGDGDYFNSDTDFSQADPNTNFVLRGSIGAASIVGNEHVYAASTGTNNLSLLVWQSTAPLANVDVKLRLPDDWTLRGHFDAALMGRGRMTDYDWIPPYNTGYGMDDWSHRSISSNALDWYFSGDVAFGRDLPISPALTINPNVGVKYTDVQWTATGGDYTYSTGGFRNDSGSFPNIAVVRYRQQLPTLFGGIDASVKDGPWTLEAGGKAGLIVYGRSRDDHYLRVPPINVVDDLSWGQMLSADARLGFDFSDHLGAFVEAAYEKTFAPHTPSTYSYTPTNTVFLQNAKSGGAELDVARVTAGFKGQF